MGDRTKECAWDVTVGPWRVVCDYPWAEWGDALRRDYHVPRGTVVLIAGTAHKGSEYNWRVLMLTADGRRCRWLCVGPLSDYLVPL